MISLSEKGKKRYEKLRVDKQEVIEVATSEDLYNEVERIIKEYMCEKKQICIWMSYLIKKLEDEMDGMFLEKGVEKKSYKKIVNSFEGVISKAELTAVAIWFSPYYPSKNDKDITRFVIVTSNYKSFIISKQEKWSLLNYYIV
ncbi:MAG: hypothetical protein K2H53_04765 [Clostridia bacterium]|nr:hypothetical protein [Clostridia bacterium]